MGRGNSPPSRKREGEILDGMLRRVQDRGWLPSINKPGVEFEGVNWCTRMNEKGQPQRDCQISGRNTKTGGAEDGGDTRRDLRISKVRGPPSLHFLGDHEPSLENWEKSAEGCAYRRCED